MSLLGDLKSMIGHKTTLVFLIFQRMLLLSSIEALLPDTQQLFSLRALLSLRPADTARRDPALAGDHGFKVDVAEKNT